MVATFRTGWIREPMMSELRSGDCLNQRSRAPCTCIRNQTLERALQDVYLREYKFCSITIQRLQDTAVTILPALKQIDFGFCHRITASGLQQP
jgi:hypothetical protein